MYIISDSNITDSDTNNIRFISDKDNIRFFSYTNANFSGISDFLNFFDSSNENAT